MLNKVTGHQDEIIMGGEFNMIRSTEEKSSGTINRAWTESFISFIAYDGLRELHIVGNKFTWTNK